MTGRSHQDDDVTRVCRLVPRPPLPQGLSPAVALLSRLLHNIMQSNRSGQADTLVAERQQSPAAFEDGAVAVRERASPYLYCCSAVHCLGG